MRIEVEVAIIGLLSWGKLNLIFLLILILLLCFGSGVCRCIVLYIVQYGTFE